MLKHNIFLLFLRLSVLFLPVLPDVDIEPISFMYWSVLESFFIDCMLSPKAKKYSSLTLGLLLTAQSFRMLYYTPSLKNELK